MSDEAKRREDSGLFDLPLQPLPRADGREDRPGPAGDPAAGPADSGPPPARRRRRPRPPDEEPELPLFADDEPGWEPEAEAAAEPEPPATAPHHPAAPPAEEPAWPAGDGAETGPRPAPAAPFAPPPRPQPAPAPAPSSGEAPRRGRAPATFRPRLVAAAVDAGVHLGAAGVGLAAALLLGVPIGLRALPAFALFLLVFSFLYSVVTLAFWGQTPGMVAAGLVARGGGDQPLTFGQTGLRWLAGLATVALAGLPLLVALSGRSLGDRLSGSVTYRRG